METKLCAKLTWLAVEGENTRLRHPDSSVKRKDSLFFWHQTASCSDIQLNYLFIISRLMMFPFPIQLIISIEHYSPHAIAKPYPNSATPSQKLYQYEGV